MHIEIKADTIDQGRDVKSELMISVDTRLTSIEKAKKDWADTHPVAAAELQPIIDHVATIREAVVDAKIILV